jgi:hypothetical protein
MLHGAQVAVCSETNIKHIKCGQNIQFLNVKPVGASDNQRALNGSVTSHAKSRL